MATLSTTAWVLHDLGLAAGFGGNLFGQMALHPAVRSIEAKRERGEVTNQAWSRFRIVNVASILAFASSWVAGRSLLSGREVGRSSRKLTLVKDMLVGGAVATGVGAMILGTRLGQAGRGSPIIESGSEPAPETPPRVKRLQRLTTGFGLANLVFEAAVLATTTVLAMKSGRSTRWKFVSRILP